MYTNNEEGRSMIEMLGVLAIVGVLSVAGIAGYTKAMDKYKASKIIDQFSEIQYNLQGLYNRTNSYKGIEDSKALDVAIAMDVFPEKMVATEGGRQVVRHAGGGTVSVSFNDNDVSVTFNDLQKDAAIALSTADIPSNWVKIGSSKN